MRLLRITGGPGSSSVRVVDVETGTDITDRFQCVKVVAEAGKLTVATFQAFVEVDVVAEEGVAETTPLGSEFETLAYTGKPAA